MEVNLIAEGFKFMALGMASVFLFLALTVYVLKIQGKILDAFWPEEKQSADAKFLSASAQNSANGGVIAAITAAITHFRKDKI
ncbi:MAG: OadG family protein [Campylobacter sp.]